MQQDTFQESVGDWDHLVVQTIGQLLKERFRAVLLLYSDFYRVQTCIFDFEIALKNIFSENIFRFVSCF